jgi:RNA recognition motif-containing protein
MILYVGNVHFGITEQQLKSVFEQYGKVIDVRLMRDTETGRSRGFGFVEIDNEQDAQLAKNELNGMEINGRNLKVNYAQKQKND